MTDEERLEELRRMAVDLPIRWLRDLWGDVQFLLAEIDRLQALLASQEARLRVQGEIIEENS